MRVRVEGGGGDDLILVPVFRVGYYDDHHRNHQNHHHQSPWLPIFFVLIESSGFLAKGKGWVFSLIVWRMV